MVLIGDRTKFNLQATPLVGRGVINIEISCDHTVGCRPEDWDIDPLEEGFSFSEWHEQRNREAFPETFNVEMELEHLGAGGSTESTGGGTSSSKESVHGSMWGLPSQIKKQVREEKNPRLGTPIGFPERRPYTKEDSTNPAFGTPSFSVFFAAHHQVIALLRQNLSSTLRHDDLGPDVQKLEAIRDKLGLLGQRIEEEPKPRRLPPLPLHVEPTERIERPKLEEITGILGESTSQPVLLPHAPTCMSLFQFNKQYRKGKGDGTGLNCLLDSLCQVAPDEVEAKFHGGGRKQNVELMREALVRAGYTKFKRMLDIAGAEEGQALLAELDIDVIVFVEEHGEVRPVCLGRSGGMPRHLHFKGAHYSPVFPK